MTPGGEVLGAERTGAGLAQAGKRATGPNSASNTFLTQSANARKRLSKIEQLLSAANRGRCYAVINQGIRRTICGE